MKEITMIQKFNIGQKERSQNNQMIASLMKDVEQLQQMASGLLGVVRELPGYDKAIKVMTKKHEEAVAKEEKERLAMESSGEDTEKAKDIEVVEPKLILGEDSGKKIS